MLVRAPVFVFQGFAASLLPNLTQLRAGTVAAAGFRQAVLETVAILLGIGALIVAAAAAAGPTAMSVLNGAGFVALASAAVLLRLAFAPARGVGRT